MTQHQTNSLIPVDAVILYRPDHSTDFHSCHVLAVSSEVVHILLDRPLDVHDAITFMVCPEDKRQQSYYLAGEVKKRGLQDGGWLHEVAASSNRPWSSRFQYDVLCSARDAVPTETEEDASSHRPRRAWVNPWAHPIACNQSMPASLP